MINIVLGSLFILTRNVAFVHKRIASSALRRLFERPANDIKKVKWHCIVISVLDSFYPETRYVVISQIFFSLPPLKVNGGWSPWGPWSACGQFSAQCGAGTRRRTRDCTDPEPGHGGRHCAGPEVQKEGCWNDEKDCQGEGLNYVLRVCTVVTGEIALRISWAAH